jgi:hypothetical protein
MSDLETAFHKRWRGLVEPVEGLVVSVPVLVAAECMHRHGPELQEKLREECDATNDWRVRSLESLFANVLGFAATAFVRNPDGISVYLPEGSETVAASYALKSRNEEAPHAMLVWDVPDIELDRPDTRDGKWAYPPKDKFDRLLRHARVPIGLLTNRRECRLFYAPHDESTGIITFRLEDMVQTQGREILDAFVMLLSSHRFFGVAKDRQLPALLADSRLRQANVTTALADQVLEALGILLRGFEIASLRDGESRLREAVEEGTAYSALLTVLLRLVFLLYAEDLSLLPVDHPHYAEHLSLLSLHARLQADAASFPDTMSRRFGAWPRLLALFRAVYFGLRHGDLSIPPRRGVLFDPAEYPFLEGWGPAGGAPTQEADRSAVRVPSVDDETVFQVLDRLIILEGERLSYRALDVEQIGSVYEKLMGYYVLRLEHDAASLRLNSKPGAARAWVEIHPLLTEPAARRASWLTRTLGFDAGNADRIANALQTHTSGDTDAAVQSVLTVAASRERDRAGFRASAGHLVLQPGRERRRTSSQYTRRSLSEPIVRRTLEPLLLAMGQQPSSARLLDLKVCDPAMGSGAFLVAACRFLAGELQAAWTRENTVDEIAKEHGNVLLHAKRLAAQRCLYGVDKNALAVNLAKLSLWLETLAKDEPFTFLDHALKHGDSLVGLSLDQTRAFHWAPEEQVDLATREIDAALSEAVRARQEILDLAKREGAVHEYVKEKERLLFDAEDALSKARLLGDLVVGAFFAKEKPKDRETERLRRLDRALAWLREGGPAPDDLLEMQREARKLPTFHWMAEFPEVFYAERPDPLEGDRVNRVAMMDAFVGNPPFLGGKSISTEHGDTYADWLELLHTTTKNADLSAHFFRRANQLLGKHGTIGFIATDKIAQGDTRSAALELLVAEEKCVIFDATPSMPWPGDASVTVSVVHLAKGSVAETPGIIRLDGQEVSTIDSNLKARAERGAPRALAANGELAFVGSMLSGIGFTLTPEERDNLIAKDPKNSTRIKAYVGGKNVNADPEQKPWRYTIDFENITLEEAHAWPDLLAIVEERVKPDRDRAKRDAHRERWWQYGDRRPGLYAAIAPLCRCLVIARDPEHFCFSFQPTDRVLNEKLYVFASERLSLFAILQSRVHVLWALARGRTTGGAGTPSYSTTTCFDTFPFPNGGPSAHSPALETIGNQLYEVRAAYMKVHQCGLTDTYNRMTSPDLRDTEIQQLRQLSEEMDRAVLAAYGWTDIEVPTFEATEDDPTRQRFEDEVLDRLFALNAERAEKERILGSAAKKPAAAKNAKKPAANKRVKKEPEDQGGLPGVE